VRTKVSQFQRSYLGHATDKRRRFFFRSSGEAENLSAGDRDVLKTKVEFPQLSVSELAKKLKISRPTVYAAIERMTTNGVLRGTAALFNANAAGIGVYHLLVKLRRTDPDTRKIMEEYCQTNPHSTYCIETIGSWQCEICLETDDHRVLQRSVAELRKLMQRTLLQLEVASFANYYVKYRFFLP
jgi:DNA-binding Lrp family transcriptional regulator